jgi:CII-binding regulator of phage lambda lysogenization HflD
MTPAMARQMMAFAGVCQAAMLVHRTANGLITDARDVVPLQRSVFATDPESNEAPEALFEPLSTVYQHSISKLPRRIQVVGSGELLQRNDVAAKVRTLLLAGVRSAWLWYQLGGRRWHLLLRRTTMRNALRDLVEPKMTH